MNKFIQFVNRKKELEFLEKQVKKHSAFIVIYGRRRVGKSELIKHFIKRKKAIYLLATQEVEKEIIESFSKEIAHYLNDPTIKISPFTKFNQLMEYIKDKNLKNCIMIIDEFPYLVDANKSVPSIIQKYWDNYLKSKGLKLILCGSSIGAMETEVLGRKSPLYGRRTGQWKVDPLHFKEFIKFFPGTQFKKLVEFYAITGGIPLYILEFDAKKTPYENTKEAIATRGSILYQEPEIILKEELREPKTYFSLLKEISAGKNTMNELSNALGIERTGLVRYMDTLIELDLVEAAKPIIAKEKSKKTNYVLNDNYFKFWFRFVYPFKKDLDSFIFDDFQKKFERNFNSYLGKQFEGICKEALRINNPIESTKIGNWWGFYRKGNERKELEIDVVSVNEDTKTVLFGECKWKDKVNAKKIAMELYGKAQYVEWHNKDRLECFAIFAKSFKEKINNFKGRKVKCYDLDYLSGLFTKHL